MRKDKKYMVLFYANSYKYGKNYLFRFEVDSEKEGLNLARKFNARAASLRVAGTTLQKRIT